MSVADRDGDAAANSDVAARSFADVAARLHDGPLQLLAVASQELDRPGGRHVYAQGLVKQAMADLRGLLEAPDLSITPSELTRSLTWWSSIVLPAGTAFELRAGDAPEGAPWLIYEAARELITNAGRHSHAPNVWATVRRDGDVLLLTVEDDGVGMEAEWRPGYGLAALRRRVHTAGGTVDHGPRRPRGTVALVRLPS